MGEKVLVSVTGPLMVLERTGLSYRSIDGVKRASLYYWSSDLMVLEELISISGPLMVLERASLYYLPVRALGKGCLCQ